MQVGALDVTTAPLPRDQRGTDLHRVELRSVACLDIGESPAPRPRKNAACHVGAVSSSSSNSGAVHQNGAGCRLTVIPARSSRRRPPAVGAGSRHSCSGVMVRLSIAGMLPASSLRRDRAGCRRRSRRTPRAGPLGRALRLADHAHGVCVRAARTHVPLPRPILDERRRPPSPRPDAVVQALLGHEVLLTPGELDAGGELVLGDGPLALDGQRATLERRAVRLGLRGLAGRGLQRALEVDSARTARPWRRVTSSPVARPARRGAARRRPGPRARRSARRPPEPGSSATGVLDVARGELAEQACDRLQRRRGPAAVAGSIAKSRRRAATSGSANR